MWQDILLAGVNWVLLVAIIPTLLHKTQKPTLTTSVLTGLCLSAIGFAYVTLDLLLAALPVGLMAASWFVLAYQRHRLNKQETKTRA